MKKVKPKFKILSFNFTLFALHFTLLLSSCLLPLARADEKQWSGAGDATYWKDDDNWSPAAVPTAADNTTISKENASVYASETFNAKELTVGGRGSAAFSSENFVYGEVAPDDATDVALYIRKDGEVTLKGAGTLTLKGAFKNSQETLTSEPGFMFGVE